MNFKSYITLSPEVRAQIDRITDIWRTHLRDALIGVYLHGSIALESFVEGLSDIDVLIVTARKIPREERLSIARELIKIEGKPSPLEMSAVYVGNLVPWQHPTRCQFHYSFSWTERYEQFLSGEVQESFIIDEDFADSDIACHARLTRERGICVYGKPIEEVIPAVSEADFWASIYAEVEDFDFHAYEPRFFPCNIISLGRVLSYKREKRILSKYESALWTIEHIPQRLRYLIENAIRAWFCGEDGLKFGEADLEEYKRLLIEEICGD